VPDHESPRLCRAAARIGSQSSAVGAIGFSSKTCLPGAKGVDRDIAMILDMGCDADDVDVRVVEQLAVIG